MIIKIIISNIFFNVSISGPYAALMSYLAEVHNDAQRSRTYMWLGVFFSLGNISLPCKCSSLRVSYLFFQKTIYKNEVA